MRGALITTRGIIKCIGFSEIRLQRYAFFLNYKYFSLIIFIKPPKKWCEKGEAFMLYEIKIVTLHPIFNDGHAQKACTF